MTSPLITTGRWGSEDGHTLDGYLKSGGYQAIQRALEISPQEVHEEVKKASLLGRAASPDEISMMALLLASEGGSFMTGHTYFVDGGQSYR